MSGVSRIDVDDSIDWGVALSGVLEYCVSVFESENRTNYEERIKQAYQAFLKIRCSENMSALSDERWRKGKRICECYSYRHLRDNEGLRQLLVDIEEYCTN